MAVTTFEPVAAEYGGTRVEAVYHEGHEEWHYAAAVQDEAGGGWQPYAFGVVPNCGRHDSEAVLAFCVSQALR